MDAPVHAPMRHQSIALAGAVLVIAVATLIGAFTFQAAGYPPCDLCLKERLPYYAAMVLAAAAVLAAWRGPRTATMILFVGLALVFLFSAGFGVYHAGVEWGLWAGPTDCTGTLGNATSTADFLQQLRTVRVVRCDAAALRVFGLSLAGWNVLVSLAAMGVALAGLASFRSSHVRTFFR